MQAADWNPGRCHEVSHVTLVGDISQAELALPTSQKPAAAPSHILRRPPLQHRATPILSGSLSTGPEMPVSTSLFLLDSALLAPEKSKPSFPGVPSYTSPCGWFLAALWQAHLLVSHSQGDRHFEPKESTGASYQQGPWHPWGPETPKQTLKCGRWPTGTGQPPVLETSGRRMSCR